MKVQVFHYKIVEELPISQLPRFAEHRRLRVFYHKGTTCVSCGLIGTKLVKGKGHGGQLHWDIYTDDYFPITVDHIIPKSKKGTDDLTNLQPMCAKCNVQKGDKI